MSQGRPSTTRTSTSSREIAASRTTAGLSRGPPKRCRKPEYPRLARALASDAESQDSRSSACRGRTVGPKRYRSIIFKPTCPVRSEEHTSELQSLRHLVCRLLLEK